MAIPFSIVLTSTEWEFLSDLLVNSIELCHNIDRVVQNLQSSPPTALYLEPTSSTVLTGEKAAKAPYPKIGGL